jgi:hypothetical protein
MLRPERNKRPREHTDEGGGYDDDDDDESHLEVEGCVLYKAVCESGLQSKETYRLFKWDLDNLFH